ncbi:MAG: ABC transporter ATP-binding protein [Chthoniobacterales bacterium]
MSSKATHSSKSNLRTDTDKSKVQQSRVAVRQISHYLRPYRVSVVIAFLALIVSTLLGLAFPYLAGLLLDAAILKEDVVAHWTHNINAVAVILLAVLGIKAVFSFFASYGFYRCGESALVDLRRESFAHLLGQPMNFFSKRRVGELSSRLSNDLTLIQDTITVTIQQFLRQLLLLTGGLILVIITSPKLAGLMVCTFPVFVFVAILFGRFIRKYARIAQDNLAEGSTIIEESLQGIAEVKAYGNEFFELNRYSAKLENFLKQVILAARLRALMISFIIFGIFGSIVLVFWYGAFLVQNNELTFGELTRFILYTTFIGGSVASFAEVYGQVQKMLGATERVRELFSEPVEIKATQPGKTATLKRLTGHVAFDEVSFRYPSRPELSVLKSVSLHAEPGEKIALVGASGAGKTTIVSLLPRFYEPETGQIRFDNIPASKLSLTDLRSNIAIVPQEVLLFGGSIEENILYGRPDASKEEILKASRLAACDEFISKFPEGYATRVGDRGVKLSGGQRQRIALARAFLKSPSILILDEATSSLDSESEWLIQQALEKLLEGRTAFIIAHRLSTIRKADRIYVIDEGRVVEQGRHEELLSRLDGTYRRLHEMQFSEEIRQPSESKAESEFTASA